MKQLEIKSAHYDYLLNSFSKWLELIGYADATVKSLPVHLREWFHFLEERNITHITKIKQRHVSEFLRYLGLRPNLLQGGGLSASYINVAAQAINTFCKYINQTGEHVLDVIARRIENDAAVPDVLTPAEIKELYDATFLHHRENTAAMGQRDRAMIAVFYGCGLRKDEGTRLNITDVDLVKRLLFVRKAKGNKQRYVPIAIKHADDIRAYLEEGRNWFLKDNRSVWHSRKRWKKQGADDEAFFIGQSGRRMQVFYHRLKYLKQSTSILKDFSTHTLRHSIATHLLQNGMKIEQIAKFLGHSSLESTQIYTHVVQYLNAQQNENDGILPLPDHGRADGIHRTGTFTEPRTAYQMD